MNDSKGTHIPEGNYLSKSQAAEVAGALKITVQKWIESGDLPAIQIEGMGYLINEADLQAFLQKPRSAGYPKGRPRKP